MRHDRLAQPRPVAGGSRRSRHGHPHARPRRPPRRDGAGLRPLRRTFDGRVRGHAAGSPSPGPGPVTDLDQHQCRTREPGHDPQDKLLANVYRVTGIGPLRKPVQQIMFSPVSLGDPVIRARVDEWIGWLKKVDRAGMRRAVFGVAQRLPVADEIDGIRARTLVVVGADDIPTHRTGPRRSPPGSAGPDSRWSRTVVTPARSSSRRSSPS